MTRIEHSVEIDAPLEEVFDYASDWQRWPEWFEGVSEFTPVTDTAAGNGARYTYTAKLMGIPAAVETEIHDFIENAGWIGVGTKGLPHQTRWVFERYNGNTRFTYTLEYRLPLSIIGVVLDYVFVRRSWENIIEKSLRNLSMRFESNPEITDGV